MPIYRDLRVLHPPQHPQSRVILQRLRITSQTKSVNRMPRTERTGFSFERKHGCRRQARRKSANDPTAPSALADAGLVLVRARITRTSRMREGWDHECQTYRRTTCDDERRGTTQDRCLSAPATIKGAALSKVSAKLAKLGVAREIEAKSGAPIWRRDDAGQGYALKLMAAGLKAIAVD